MLPSSPLNFRRAIIWIGRLVLAGLFLYAGYSKIFMPTTHPRPSVAVALSFFAMQVDSYQLLPPWAVNLVAHALPFAEVALGVLLLVGWQLRVWATMTTIVMLGFFTVVLRSYALGLQINCGCFANPEPLDMGTVIRDGLLAVLAVLMTVLAYVEARLPHPWSEKT